MKKQITLFISAVLLLIAGLSTSVYAGLGESLDKYVTYYFESTNSCATVEFCEFGMIIYWGGLKGGHITVYRYGEEDLPGLGKISSNNEVIKPEENVSIYVYEANDIGKPQHEHLMVTKGENLKDGTAEYLLQNPDFDLKKEKPYIVILRNEKGVILKVEKIILK